MKIRSFQIANFLPGEIIIYSLNVIQKNYVQITWHLSVVIFPAGLLPAISERNEMKELQDDARRKRHERGLFLRTSCSFLAKNHRYISSRRRTDRRICGFLAEEDVAKATKGKRRERRRRDETDVSPRRVCSYKHLLTPGISSRDWLRLARPATDRRRSEASLRPTSRARLRLLPSWWHETSLRLNPSARASPFSIVE